MKIFMAVFAAVLLAGAVLIGYVNYSKEQDAKWAHVLDLANQSVVATAKICVLSPTKEHVERFRDAVKDQRAILARNAGTPEAKIKAKDITDDAVSSVQSVLETGTAEARQLAKLLDGY